MSGGISKNVKKNHFKIQLVPRRALTIRVSPAPLHVLNILDTCRRLCSAPKSTICQVDMEDISREIERGASSLRFRWKRLGDPGAIELARLLSSTHKVKEIDLTGCDVGDEGITALAKYLAADTEIEIVDLNCNSYTDDGMAALGKMLITNASITLLDVSGSRSGDPGIESLADALESANGTGNTTLRELKVTRNAIGFGIGLRGVSALRRVLDGNASLTSLSLWGSKVGDRGSEQLALGLAANASMTWLDLGWNDIGDAGAAHLAACLETNSTLLSIDLRNNLIGSKGVLTLNSVLGRWSATLAGGADVGNVTLEAINLGGNPVFREGEEEEEEEEVLGNGAESNTGRSETDDAPNTEDDDADDDVAGLRGFLAVVDIEDGRELQEVLALEPSGGDGDGKTAVLTEIEEGERVARAQQPRAKARREAEKRKVEARAEARLNAQQSVDELIRHLLPTSRTGRMSQANSLLAEFTTEQARIDAEALAVANTKAGFERQWVRNSAIHLGFQIEKLPGMEAKRLWNNSDDDRRLWKNTDHK